MDNSQIDENPIRCKTILVGNSGVGKTSIISRYLGKFNRKEKTTIGASFTNKLETIDGKIYMHTFTESIDITDAVLNAIKSV